MKILIAEDDAIPRRLLQATLTKSGYEVVTAQNGTEAWEMLQANDAPRLAILDWLMPGMDGVDVCREVRKRANAPYVYLILLTSKDTKEDIVAGMEAGADDYLTKPFHSHELQVRLRAGQRILELESELLRSYEELAQAHRREGEIGAKIQQTLLLGQPPSALPAMQVAALTIPSRQIDGDFYDFFAHQDSCLDVIVGDVMGKGIAAALLGAAIKSQFLRALSHLPGRESGRLPEPEAIVSEVHTAVTGQFIGLEFFATLIYARFDSTQGQITFVDCGHTKTLRLRPGTGGCDVLEGINMPLGVSEKEIYRQMSASFVAGDVFCFYSDGVTEAHEPNGEQFGMERLMTVLTENGQAAPQELLAAIHRAVVAFTQSDKFADDLTCVVVKTGETVGNAAEIGMDSESDRAQTWITSELSQLAAARAFVRDFCVRAAQSRPDEEGIAQLELAITEAVSNIIRHAYEGRSARKIEIEAETAPDGISIRLRHDGQPFDPDATPPPSFDGSREGGFGVYLIANSVDTVRYARDNNGGNIVHLFKKMQA